MLALGAETRLHLPSYPSRREHAIYEPLRKIRDRWRSDSGRISAPWSAASAPSYWFAGTARKTLDFTDWPTYDARHRADELRAIAKVVRDGEMPPWGYTALDSSARLTPDEQEYVADWADRTLATRMR